MLMVSVLLESATDFQRTAVGAEGVRNRSHSFRSPQKVSLRLASGRSPGLEGQHVAVLPLRLPRRRRVADSETANPHSQWRDRAGFSPDFPVMPSKSAPERDFQYARSNPEIASEAPRRPAASTSSAARGKSPASPAGGSEGSPSQMSVTSRPPTQIGPTSRR